MCKYIIIVLCLLVSGCESGPRCYEVIDGAGRMGVYISFDGRYVIMRMDDNGYVEAHNATRVNCKIKLAKEDTK